MEVWGGVECSINRVRDEYFDQLAYDKQYDRPELLEELIKLGIKTFRYPILWEKNWPIENIEPNWAIHQQLSLFKENGINIIAGLVHHGSGPLYAEIQSDDFPEKLAEYARKVAKAFPWINDFTPVNEPLTTARFCGLYGLWYPHVKSTKSFLEILINECKGTILAMKAIREINPKARLILTEDLTKIHGTEELKAQVNFENNRKWLSIDLICGRVKIGHPLWEWLLQQQISEESLYFFNVNAMLPDVLGFNYYVTSERYLDHRIEDYHTSSHGGNGLINYVDIEAVRHPDAKAAGLTTLLLEAWERYQLPMAITEAHLCCGREDQLRWLKSIWEACVKLNRAKITIVGVTFWSIFGAYGWNKLLTQKKGSYEPGAFDLSSGAARPTAIASFITSLTNQKYYANPLVKGKGWWEIAAHKSVSKVKGKLLPPILIVGGSGTLGYAFTKICTERNIQFIAPNRNMFNINNIEQIQNVIKKYKPWAIINASGYVNVDAAEQDVEDCLISNTIGPINLATCCQEHGIHLLSFSSDLVFDGSKSSPYTEDDLIRPLNIYGHSKAEAELHILSINPSSLVVRSSAFFGPWDQYNFVSTLLKNLKRKNTHHAIDDVKISATYVPHLVNTSLDLLIDQEKGIWHLSNIGTVSWYELAVMVAKQAGYDSSNIKKITQVDAKLSAKRPKNSSLVSTRGKLMPTLQEGLDAYFNEINYLPA